MEKGAHLVLRTVKAIEAGGYPQEPQNEENEIKHAPKIFKETCEIDWTKSSEEGLQFYSRPIALPCRVDNVKRQEIQDFCGSEN